ncbi:MAG: HipA domain-containing protein [Hyphomicrobiales bacterium]|nr:HipA domain-containing protein [Hyphomicrobiales bacterium]
MTSRDKRPDEAYVWIWLPGETVPVVAGRLYTEEDTLRFNYGRSYLERPNAISIYPPELPLQSGELALSPGLSMPGCIRDGSPDAWGRRVLINRMFGLKGSHADVVPLDELTCLLESGSDRFGALDFQLSPTEYTPRNSANASFEELLEAAERIEKGLPLSPGLDLAFRHASSIGGARPKALLETNNKKYIAKFSSSSDPYNVMKAEFVAMRIGCLAGLNVASVKLETSAGKDVLLVERFDREKTPGGWTRRAAVSALTLFKLDEMMMRYASYEDLAGIIRFEFEKPKETLKELFGRLVFNILCGNTDDHARNHAAFWDGRNLSLTPAYDICPQNRTGNEATQAMSIINGNSMSRVSVCLKASHLFQLSKEEAAGIIENMKDAIHKHWDNVCDEAGLSDVDKAFFKERQFLNPFAFE